MRSFWGATKPPAGTALDRSHPLSQGLRAAFLMAEGAGAPVDSVRGTILTPLSTTTWGGQGLRCDAVGEGADAQTPTYLQLGLPITIACQATIIGASTGSAILFGVSHSNADVSPWESYHLGINTATTSWFLQGNSGGTFKSVQVAGENAFYGKRVTLVGVLTASGGTLYINGSAAGTIAGPLSAPTYGATSRLQIGTYVTADRTPNAVVELGVIANAAWTAAEAQAFAAQPYAMFAAPVWSRLYSFPPAPQLARPASDVTPNAWHDQTGGTTNLYAALNEASADDATYIEGPSASATPSEQKVRLAALIDPGVSTGHVLRYRYEKDVAAGDTVNLTVTLYAADGTTVIASQQHTNITDTVTAGTLTLSGAEADAIPAADYGTGLVVGFSEVKA